MGGALFIFSRYPGQFPFPKWSYRDSKKTWLRKKEERRQFVGSKKQAELYLKLCQRNLSSIEGHASVQSICPGS